MEFRPGAGKVKVCDHCNTVVLRGEANLERLGKVADLVDTQSPIKLRLAGQYSGSTFTVVGRIQKTHGAGTWDEWCLSFDDGRDAWLSESEGEWNLMFPLDGVAAPAIESLRPLSSFQLRDRTFVVEEVGDAQVVSAEGQLPAFNQRHAYADATGQKGTFCSLDSADGAASEAFVGHRVALTQLGFDHAELVPTPKKEALKQARCPNCNGPLELKAPDAAKRVACPYCGALLDASHGQLAFLQLLEKLPYQPVVPLGSEGTFEKTKFTVLAFLIRSTTVEDTRYPWEEYLLWNAKAGFRWLMHANGHWTFLTPIAAGDVGLAFRSATWSGKKFRAFQSVFARTDFVAGECYWEVSVGDVAKASEYVAPPESINSDETNNEVVFTHGRMLDAAEVKAAFSIKEALPAASGIAPAQVNPSQARISADFGWAAVWATALLVLIAVFTSLGDTRQFLRSSFSVPPNVKSGTPESQLFSEPFTIDKKVPLEVEIEAPWLDNAWLAVQLDLVNETTGEVVQVSPEASYYSGVDDGERWTEGSRSASKQTSEVDPGSYVLRASPMFESTSALPREFVVTVKADSGVGVCCPLFIFLLLFAVPLVNVVRSSAFETRRWNEAVFQTAPNVSTFPYSKEDE